MKIVKRGSEVVANDPSRGALARDRADVYPPRPRRAGRGVDTCCTPHPRRSYRTKGITHFITCDRPLGHKGQHRAPTPGGGQAWWG